MICKEYKGLRRLGMDRKKPKRLEGIGQEEWCDTSRHLLVFTIIC